MLGTSPAKTNNGVYPTARATGPRRSAYDGTIAQNFRLAHNPAPGRSGDHAVPDRHGDHPTDRRTGPCPRSTARRAPLDALTHRDQDSSTAGRDWPGEHQLGRRDSCGGATMHRAFLGGSLALALFVLCECSVPPFVLFADHSVVAPAGPKVAALMANLKCELWEAAHSDEILPYYRDDPSLEEKIDDPKDPHRLFTLHNLFEEIDYVAAAQFTLDVIGSSAANPSVNFIHPYLTPMTNVTLAVSGQLSDTAHRYVNIYTSVDFARLSPSYKVGSEIREELDTKLARRPSILPCDNTNFGPETQLAGEIGLKETLASGIIMHAMNDVALFQASAPTTGSPLSSLPNEVGSVTGQIAAQIDFTVVAGLGGGPNWTLIHFKGPSAGGGGSGSGNSNSGGGSSSSGGGGSQSLLNFNRQAKDTLIITFVPVCVREKYTGYYKDHDKWLPLPAPQGKTASPPYKYEPEMIVGTPGWANYLLPCTLANKAAALQSGSTNNKFLQLQQFLLPPQ